MKKFVFSSILLLSLSINAHATLIGDEVSSTHVLSTAAYDTDTVVVTADNSDLMNGFNNYNFYTIDVNASNIFITHTSTNWTEILGFHGFTIFDLNDSSGLGLSSITVNTDIANWSADRLTFNQDQLWVQLAGDSFSRLGTGYLDFELSFGDANSVPEPSSLALIALGLAGVGFARKKKAA